MRMERQRFGSSDLEIVPLEDLGSDELFTQGLQGWKVVLELAVRACRELGIERATVPESFPVGHGRILTRRYAQRRKRVTA